MITYITAEEFLNQSDKVKMSLLNYVNQNITDFDLVYTEEKVYLYKDYAKRENIEVDSYPLMQIHQLIGLIEDKTCGKIEIEYCFYTGYYFHVYNCDSELVFKKFEIAKDLLQALWQVTIQIAREE